MTRQEVNEILAECSIECNKIYGNALSMYLGYREFLFMYLDKYDIDYVTSYKFE